MKTKFIYSSYLKLFLILALFSGVSLIFSCSEGEPSSTIGGKTSGFVGDVTCQSCHPQETINWTGSHHDYAMKEATNESVRGDFNNTTFSKDEEVFYFTRQDSMFYVDIETKDKRTRYPVLYTFGWEPLQQYLVDIGQGKLQALHVSWDTEKHEWFALYPNDKLVHGDWLHWTSTAMNWNTMCADCHSTNLKQNYFAEADSFHTTWSSINVSCESCHGPGLAHIRLMESDSATLVGLERIRKDLELTRGTQQEVQINQCAQCHSRRQELDETYDHKGDFLDHFTPQLIHPELYFPDGQIKDEVYVYGSFLQSKMYTSGVTCTDCHDPHSLKLRASVTDNTLCMSCHVPSYNSPEHHFHEANTEASQCISCHMPGTYYMEVDFRRDHSFRVPRPDLSDDYGSPNACNGCHTDQTTEWAANAIEAWYGVDRYSNYAELLALASSGDPSFINAITDTLQPEIVRATLIWYMREFPGAENAHKLGELLKDNSGLIRTSTAQTLASYPPSLSASHLRVAESDSLRSVRVFAGQGLSKSGISYGQAIADYEKYLEHNLYFPEGQMNQGIYFEQIGNLQGAIDAYVSAIEKNPEFNPARINLAYLYNRLGRNYEAEALFEKVIAQEPDYGNAYYSMALLLAEEGRLEESISYFDQAAELIPGNHRLFYNLALTHQNLKQWVKSENAYEEALKFSPDNPEYLYGLATMYLQQQAFDKAEPIVERLIRLAPNVSQYQQLKNYIQSNR